MVDLFTADTLGAALGAFAAMAIIEGAVKPIAIRAWNHVAGAGMEALPLLYELTDPLIPDWLYDGDDIEAKARARYLELTGLDLPDGVLAEWRRRLDLQKIADLYANGDPHRPTTEPAQS